MSGAVLVTGARGLVGGAVAAALRRSGAEVVGLDLEADTAGGVVACDLLDAQRLAAIADEASLAAIVHCGAVSGPSLFRNDPAHVARTNFGSTLNVMELARTRQVPRVVFASSGSVYGRTEDQEVRESRALHPSSVYAATKIAGEALVEAYSSQYGVSGVSLRIAAVYGPARRTSCAVREMILAGHEGRRLALPSGGKQRYHYVHVDDVAAAVVAAMRAAILPQRAYSVAADAGMSLKRLAALVREIVPGPPIVVEDAEDPESDPQGPYDLSAIERDLGWKAAVDLPTGIRSYAAFLLQKM